MTTTADPTSETTLRPGVPLSKGTHDAATPAWQSDETMDGAAWQRVRPSYLDDTQLRAQPAEVAPPPPPPSRPKGRPGWPLVAAVLGITLAAVGGVTAWTLYGERDGAQARVSATTTPSATTSATTPPVGSTPKVAPSTKVITVTKTSGSGSAASQRHTSRTSDPEPVDNENNAAVGASIQSGTWITIVDNLKSMNYSYSDALAKAAAYGPAVEVTHSSKSGDFAQKNVWVLFVADQGSRRQAVDLCGAYGRPVGECYPKYMGSGA